MKCHIQNVCACRGCLILIFNFFTSLSSRKKVRAKRIFWSRFVRGEKYPCKVFHTEKSLFYVRFYESFAHCVKRTWTVQCWRFSRCPDFWPRVNSQTWFVFFLIILFVNLFILIKRAYDRNVSKRPCCVIKGNFNFVGHIIVIFVCKQINQNTFMSGSTEDLKHKILV